MIKVENIETFGWSGAIHGMRNPMNSWNKSDTIFDTYWGKIDGHECIDNDGFNIGTNDLDLMKRLCKAGTEHRKFLRMIHIQMDVTAPLYWWSEYDTYKIGTTANSCSKMHKLTAKEFELDDFSYEHLDVRAKENLNQTISILNDCRNLYINYNPNDFEIKGCPSKKDIWWQLIQLLPLSYNQRRTVDFNYEVAMNVIKQRTNHKLDEWNEFVETLENLPYMKEFNL